MASRIRQQQQQQPPRAGYMPISAAERMGIAHKQPGQVQYQQPGQVQYQQPGYPGAQRPAAQFQPQQQPPRGWAPAYQPPQGQRQAHAPPQPAYHAFSGAQGYPNVPVHSDYSQAFGGPGGFGGPAAQDEPDTVAVPMGAVIKTLVEQLEECKSKLADADARLCALEAASAPAEGEGKQAEPKEVEEVEDQRWEY